MWDIIERLQTEQIYDFFFFSVIDYSIINTLDVVVMSVNICQMKFPHYLSGCRQRVEILTAK